MLEPNLHVVSFDVPFPANYGGVIDVFYRIKALHEVGVRIHLHCFTKGRKIQPELAALCDTVNVYPRTRKLSDLLSPLPFIVQSRRSELLLQNLSLNDYPILFEGLHTTYWIDHHALAGRYKIIRAHNVEHDYYAALAHAGKGFFKNQYYRREAHKLLAYEPQMAFADLILAISAQDEKYFRSMFSKVERINPFSPKVDMEYRREGGNYVLYHGNLYVPENAEAARYLVLKVAPLLNAKLIVAGAGAGEIAKEFPNPPTNLEFIEAPDAVELLELARNAGVHLLPTFQSTGFKLKLLFALRTGRHVVVNDKMVEGTGLHDLCHVAVHRDEMAALCNRLISEPFEREEFERRNNWLENHFSNRESALKLREWIQKYAH